VNAKKTDKLTTLLTNSFGLPAASIGCIDAGK
jgi:hypothetical protein